MSDRDLNLDGGEISLLKALGLSGTEVTGEDLLARCPDMTEAELIDTLKGLMMLGYVVCDGGSFHDAGGMKNLNFRVNSGYAKDLRESLNPQPSKPKSKRVRRE